MKSPFVSRFAYDVHVASLTESNNWLRETMKKDSDEHNEAQLKIATLESRLTSKTDMILILQVICVILLALFAWQVFT